MDPNLKERAMVRPIKEFSLATKFRRDNYKQHSVMKVFEEGDIWLEVLLTQLAPTDNAISEVEMSNVSKKHLEHKFHVEESLARLHFDIQNID